MSLRYFNQTGWTAIFHGTDTEIGRMVRVEGWDQATGTALVVDSKRGALRPVTDYEDFSHLEKAEHVVAAVPGGGWRVHWADEGPGGTPLTEQVLAWLITSQGRSTAIMVDAHGHVEDADGADAFIPPGEERMDRIGPARRRWWVWGPGRWVDRPASLDRCRAC
ncbi:hypothetical protein [Streptomyces griseoflavus]|uniref:hypothetical protein n=1 Tax=Streptomyces griseoflavus TaxID=35619 RepID=UPI001FCBF2E8|nr:hypothetical protein [Streptomyces griseoflavus]